MYTKTLENPIDWLSEINGLTVADAIKYLQTLDQSHELGCYMEGDTHGCDIVARLYYKVEMTNQEIYSMLEKKYLKEIAMYTAAKSEHIRRGRPDRVENCDKALLKYNTLLQDAKINTWRINND